MAGLTLQGMLRPNGAPFQVIDQANRTPANAQLIITTENHSNYADGASRWAFPIYGWVNPGRTAFETINGNSIVVPGAASGGTVPAPPELIFKYRILDTNNVLAVTDEWKITAISTSSGNFDFTAVPPGVTLVTVPSVPAANALLTSDLGVTVASQAALTSGLALKKNIDPTALTAIVSPIDAADVFDVWDTSLAGLRKATALQLQTLDTLPSALTTQRSARANLGIGGASLYRGSAAFAFRPGSGAGLGAMIIETGLTLLTTNKHFACRLRVYKVNSPTYIMTADIMAIVNANPNLAGSGQVISSGFDQVRIGNKSGKLCLVLSDFAANFFSSACYVEISSVFTALTGATDAELFTNAWTCYFDATAGSYQVITL